MRDWKVGVCVAALLVTPVLGTPQQPTPQPTPAPQPTLRIGVTAVEIDAVVVDGKADTFPISRRATSNCCKTASRSRSPASATSRCANAWPPSRRRRQPTARCR